MGKKKIVEANSCHPNFGSGTVSDISNPWFEKTLDCGGNLTAKVSFDLVGCPRFQTTISFKDECGYYLFADEFAKFEHAFQLSRDALWEEYLKYSFAHDRES